MRVLVTGATGFVGKHLVRHLLDAGHTVTATGHTEAEFSDSNVQFSILDLTDKQAVRDLPLEGVQAVIHLAGLAAVGPSYDDPAKYVSSNTTMQINIFERFKELGYKPRVLVISSGSVYKNPQNPRDLPLTELSPIQPPSPYAVSKLSQELLTQYYNQTGFDTIIARPFNHFGPGQEAGFIAADLSKQIAECALRKKKKIRVGDLNTQRDYTDVRDIVRAYLLLLEKGQPRETYNICSGKAISGKTILAKLLEAEGEAYQVEQDRSLFRPADTPVVYGSYHKLREATGWEPTFSLDSTLNDTLLFWKKRLDG